MTKKHFVFDVDDTLIDSYGSNQQIFVDTFLPYLDLANKETEQYLRELHYENRGSSMDSQFEEVIKHFSLKLNLNDLVRKNEKIQIERVEKIKIFDAVEELVKILVSRNRKVSICTNRQKQSLMKILDKHGIGKYLSNIVSCADAGHPKPDPYCLIEMIKKSREPKKNFIYFGDSRTDYQFATNAKIDFIILDYYLNQKFYKLIIQSFI